MYKLCTNTRPHVKKTVCSDDVTLEACRYVEGMESANSHYSLHKLTKHSVMKVMLVFYANCNVNVNIFFGPVNRILKTKLQGNKSH